MTDNMKAILGEKKLMTQIFKEDGKVVPVTIIDVSEVYIGAIKTKAKDGYEAVLLCRGKKKHSTKAEQGKYKKLGFVPQFAVEVRDYDMTVEIGSKIDPEIFTVDEVVDATGTTKSKGFQGVVKRWGFQGGPATHGQSDRWRAPGSIGQRMTPGRVFKGMKMAGRMGGAELTVKNLIVVAVDKENGLIAIKGAVPGNKGSLVMIKSMGKADAN
jgi:large subunit ribosomal protein L3